jgi:hypothetical protein
MLVVVSLFLTMNGFAYDVSTREDVREYRVTGISITADRTSPTHVDIDAVGRYIPYIFLISSTVTSPLTLIISVSVT